MDNELKFDECISKVCKKAQRKLLVLTRIKEIPRFQKVATFTENIF